MIILLDIFLFIFVITILFLIINRLIFMKEQKKDSIMFIIIILLRTFLFIISILIFSDIMISADSERYLYEIQQISQNPFGWNPFTGEGINNYSETPKMGMSYLYGWIIYIFNTDVIYTILLMNYFFAILTIVYLYKIFKFYKFTLMSRILFVCLSFHPELFLWNVRILRETIGIFLVIYITYIILKYMKEKIDNKDIIMFACANILLFLVRRQLTLLVFIGLVFLLAHFIKKLFNNMIIYYFSIISFTLLFYTFIRLFMLPLLNKVMGSYFSNLFLLKPYYISESLKKFIPNTIQMFSLISEGYGFMGIFIIPFNILKIIFLVIIIISFFKCRDHSIKMLTIVTILFYFSLLLNNSVNIRFAIYVTPLIFICVNYYFSEKKYNQKPGFGD